MKSCNPSSKILDQLTLECDASNCEDYDEEDTTVQSIQTSKSFDNILLTNKGKSLGNFGCNTLGNWNNEHLTQEIFQKRVIWKMMKVRSTTQKLDDSSPMGLKAPSKIFSEKPRDELRKIPSEILLSNLLS